MSALCNSWLPWAVISLALAQLTLASCASDTADCRTIAWDQIPADALTDIPFKTVDRSILEYPPERRGFVSVPLDYSRPADRRIDIFYRLMPFDGPAASGSAPPILVVMNGGPGAPSSIYRALEHDYEGDNESDAFRELSRHFRVLAVDQRGTGHSAPLDLDNPALSPEVIARFFDSDEHARDHAQVIDAVIPEGENFFILARSYGGEIGFQYVIRNGEFRQPAGMIFSSAVLPHTDPLETFVLRRKKQRELNLELQRAVPEIVPKLDRLRRHLESLEMDRGTVNFLWSDLGKGAGWEAELETKIDKLLAIRDRDAMEADFGRGIQASVNLLNYVLSSAALTPGYTDRTMTEETSRRVPFEEWMLDENWTLTRIGNDGTWREGFIHSVDCNPPPPTPFPRVEQIRAALAENRILFTFGKSDAFLSQELQLKRAQRFNVPDHTEFRVFSGGHGAAFSAEGAAVVADWAAVVLARSEN